MVLTFFPTSLSKEVNELIASCKVPKFMQLLHLSLLIISCHSDVKPSWCAFQLTLNCPLVSVICRLQQKQVSRPLKQKPWYKSMAGLSYSESLRPPCTSSSPCSMILGKCPKYCSGRGRTKRRNRNKMNFTPQFLSNHRFRK